MSLGEHLRNLREAKGLSIRQLAGQLGYEPSYLSKIEHGDRLPSEEALLSLARALEADLDVLRVLMGQFPPDLVETIRRHPREFTLFLKTLKNVTPKTLDRMTRAVRDGDW